MRTGSKHWLGVCRSSRLRRVDRDGSLTRTVQPGENLSPEDADLLDAEKPFLEDECPCPERTAWTMPAALSGAGGRCSR